MAPNSAIFSRVRAQEFPASGRFPPGADVLLSAGKENLRGPGGAAIRRFSCLAHLERRANLVYSGSRMAARGQHGRGVGCSSGFERPPKALAQNKKAAIAQSVEHVIRNDGVGGSNPSCGTTTCSPHSPPIV